MLSKSIRYVEDYPTPQPSETTTTLLLVHNHVMDYINAPGLVASPWIISAGVNLTVMEIFGGSTLLTVQTLITGHWYLEGPSVWTQADPHPYNTIHADHSLSLPTKGTVYTTDCFTQKPHVAPDILVLEHALDIAALMGMDPVMIDDLAADAFPSHMHENTLHVFWTGVTPTNGMETVS